MKIDFELGEKPFVFKDAIVLPDDHTMTDAEIDTLKQARYDAWYAVVTAPSDEVSE